MLPFHLWTSVALSFGPMMWSLLALRYGMPLAIEGNRLVEGSGVVEVTEGHLRIVVGDPSYGGWIWSYEGPWYRGWNAWFGRQRNHRYAESLYQKLTRTVDPGFHSLRFNSLEIERVPPPAEQSLYSSATSSIAMITLTLTRALQRLTVGSG